VSCSSGADLLDMPAGYLASRLAAVPFYAYLFDTYSHMWLPQQTPHDRPASEPFFETGAGVVATKRTVPRNCC